MKLKKNTSTLLRGLFQVFVVGALMLSMFVTSPVKAVAGVDLIITGYTITPPDPDIGEAFTISVTIQNIGSVSTASPVYRHVFVDTGDPNLLETDPETGCPSTEPPYENYFRPGINQQIDPGGTDTRDIEVTSGLATGGAHELWLYVDATCIEVEEDDETNNAFGPISFVLPGFSSGHTDVDVTINGIHQGTYPLDPDEEKLVKYPTAVGGPVVIKSNNGVGIVASLLQLRRPKTTGGYTGITQLLGVPESQLSSSYAFPYYNGTDASVYNSIEFSNLDTIATDVTVTIAGVARGTYPLEPNTAQSVRYSLRDGPVIVSSSNGAKIIAQIYELKKAETTGPWTGQSQMMGVQLESLSDTYIFPWYNGTLAGLDATLMFANVGAIPTNVTVTINGIDQGTYPLDPNEEKLVKYPAAVGGPVVIKSDNGTEIVASLLQLRRPKTTGGYTGITQLLGVPESQLSSSYAFPYYNGTDASLYNSIEFSNLDTIATNVTVTIAGVAQGTYPLEPNTAQSVRYSLRDGPVIVSSSNGAKIIAQIYELKKEETTGPWTGQSQMMGVQLERLSDTYIFPWYNGTLAGLDATLMFAVP